MTEGITKGIATLNPYQMVQAETISWSEGVKASQNQKVGVFITATKDGAYSSVKNVDFGSNGASSFAAG